jgi:hypothetical protein
VFSSPIDVTAGVWVAAVVTLKLLATIMAAPILAPILATTLATIIALDPLATLSDPKSLARTLATIAALGRWSARP